MKLLTLFLKSIKREITYILCMLPFLILYTLYELEYYPDYISQWINFYALHAAGTHLAILGYMLLWTPLFKAFNVNIKSSLIIVFILTFFISTANEFSQLYNDRVFDVIDLYYQIAGLFTGVVNASIIEYYFKNR